MKPQILFLAALFCFAPVTQAQRRTELPIFEAAGSGDVEKLRPFVADAAQAKVTDSSGDTPLHKVLNNHNGSNNAMRAMVELLIEKGADPNARNNFGQTPLHLAARSGNDEIKAIVALLLEKGADPKARDKRGQTPLHWIEKPESAVLLLQKGADPNALNEEGQTPLHIAASSRIDVVAPLLASGADAGKRDANGDLPIHLALRGQYRRATPELIAKSDLAARDSLGMSAIQAILATGDGQMRQSAMAQKPVLDEVTQVFEIVARNDAAALKTLVEAKSYLAYSRLPNGQTPLHLAARSLARDCIEFLLLKKADPNARDARAHTPLHEIFGSRNREALPAVRRVAEMLIKGGADPNALSGDGFALLHAAFYLADKDLFALLLQNGANPNLRGRRGATPLHMVMLEFGSREIAPDLVALLLSKGAEINALGPGDNNSEASEGLTPLSLAVSRSNSDAGLGDKLVPVLLEKGADLSARDDAGNTVFHLAAVRAKKETLALLLAAKNAPDALAIRNLKGRTPLGSAIAAKNDVAAEQIRAAGGKE